MCRFRPLKARRFPTSSGNAKGCAWRRARDDDGRTEGAIFVPDDARGFLNEN